jgi:glycosyltransferase involved in cell wall biosynthesis
LLTYPVGNDIQLEGVNHIRAKVPFYKKTSAGPSLSKIYADFLLFCKAFTLIIKNKYDLIVGEDFEGGFLSFVMSKLLGKVFIYSMYNPLKETIRPYTKKSGVIKFCEGLDYFIERNTKNIATEWEYEYERIKKLYPDKNISLVPDAFPEEKEKVEGFENKEYIFYAGNFKEYQGIDLLLESFKEYLDGNRDSDINLVLAGDKYEEMEEYSKELGIDKRVIFTGSLSLIQTNYMISNSLFCVLPRTIDGPPGMKALHYFSQGKSILGTDLSCNRKVIEDRKSGLLVKPNADSMKDGIEKMVEGKEFRKSLEEYIEKEGIGKQERANEGVQKLVRIISQ